MPGNGARVGPADWIRRLLRGTDKRGELPRLPDHSGRTGDVPLPNGTTVGRYRLERILGRGGFGFTYLATDEQLGGNFAIKEYLPRDIGCRLSGNTIVPVSAAGSQLFDWGLKSFLDEARRLRKLSSPTAHPNVVAVRDYVQAFGSGYLVMDYYQGETLAARLQRERTIEEKPLLRLLEPILNGLEHIHAHQMIHRDVKPDNIYIRNDGSPVLLDLGAARQSVGERTQTMTTLLTPGFAPLEQYAQKGKFGPATDLYGLGATLYTAICGEPPLESVARVAEDDIVKAIDAGRGRYSPQLLHAIDAALAIHAKDRPQSVTDWRTRIADLLTVDRNEHGKEAEEKDARSFGEFLDEQNFHFHAGRFEDALALVIKARKVHGENYLLWNQQGICLSDLGRHREALDCFERGLELRRDFQHLWCNKGRTLRAMGRQLEALVCYDKAIPLNPSEPTPWDCKGNCLLDLGRREEARACFRRVLELDPAHAAAKSKVGE